MYRLLLAAAAVAAPLLATPRPKAPAPHAPKTAAATLDLFTQRWSKDDTAGVAALLEDSVVMNDRATISGKDAVMKWATGEMMQTGRLTVTHDMAHVVKNYAVDAGRWKLMMADGKTAHRGTHMFVFDHQPDGSWKIAKMFIPSDPE